MNPGRPIAYNCISCGDPVTAARTHKKFLAQQCGPCFRERHANRMPTPAQIAAEAKQIRLEKMGSIPQE